MLNIFLIFITAITVSMYYFPFAFRFMPTMVGKTIMAAIGLALILVQWARKHQAGFDKEMYMLVIGGSLVSLVSIISAIVNHTPDYLYFHGCMDERSLLGLFYYQTSAWLLIRSVGVQLFDCCMYRTMHFSVVD